MLRNVEKWNKQNAYEKFLGISIKRKQHTQQSTNKLWGISGETGATVEDCVVGERKTVKNRNRNHIFFISTIVGWSLLWFEAVTAPETDSTCFALNDRETFIHSHTRTHTHKHIQLAELAYESCGKSVSLNFENVLQFPKISTHSHRGKEHCLAPRRPTILIAYGRLLKSHQGLTQCQEQQ